MITRWSHDLLSTVVAGCCSALASFVRHIHPSPHGGDPTVYSPIRPGQLMISAKRPTTEVTKAVHHQQKNKNWCRLNHLSPIVRSRRLSLRVANKKNWGTTPQHSPVLASRKNIYESHWNGELHEIIADNCTLNVANITRKTTTTSDSMAKQLLYTLYVAYCYLTYPNARLSLSWLIKYSCQQ